MGAGEETVQRLQHRLDDLSGANERQAQQIKEFAKKMEVLDSRCRALNEQVCILKGTIRVMIRVRPLLTPEEKACGSGHLNYSYDDEGRDQIVIKNQNNISKISTDKIIRESMSQESVFTEIQSMVQSALDGHNVCMFAYGQTGSGKTYSMEGPDGKDDETEGLIPRTAKYLLEEALKSALWKYTFKSNYIEIYCDKVFDLLSKSTDEVKAMLIKDKPVHYNPALKAESITSVENIYDTITKATRRRRTAATDFNERSSRSHAVFTLNVIGENTQTHEKIASVIQLIDLAGSECAKDSGAYQGQGKIEARAINTSLSALTRVISSLKDKQSHVNFRDSKLTGILEPALTKTSKVMMMVHLNPSKAQVAQTVFAAKFAESANSTKIGSKSKSGKHKINSTIT